MTLLTDPAPDTSQSGATGKRDEHVGAGTTPPTESVGGDTRELLRAWANPRRLALLVSCFLAVLLVTVVVVIYLVGPLVHERDQRTLLNTERTAIANAARDNEGIRRPTLPTQPPVPGEVVGILAIPSIGMEQAVVEGAGPSQTVSGPGHVPGTAGLGQPGNSAVVGRRAGYGSPFGNLKDVRVGAKVIVATTEGQSIYLVKSVRLVTITTPTTGAIVAANASSTGVSATSSASTTAPTAAPSSPAAKATGSSSMTTTKLYGTTGHNQLTLVTSGSAAPWNSDAATVVVARLHGTPYSPEPQESMSPSQLGNGGDTGALAWFLLDLIALLAILFGSAIFYRRTTLRSAYLLTTAPLLVFTILAAEAVSRLLPAWL